MDAELGSTFMEHFSFPEGFTMLQLKGKHLDTMNFQVVQADWNNNLTPIGLLDIDDPKFQFRHRQLNPLIYGEILYSPLQEEVNLLRSFLLEWLQTQSQRLNY